MKNKENIPHESKKAAGFEKVAKSNRRQKYVFGAFMVGLYYKAFTESFDQDWESIAIGGTSLLFAFAATGCTLSALLQENKHRRYAREAEEEYLQEPVEATPDCVIEQLAHYKKLGVPPIMGECLVSNCLASAQLDEAGEPQIMGDKVCIKWTENQI